MKKKKNPKIMNDPHRYVDLFMKACERYRFGTNSEGEYILSQEQKDRVNRFIRMNW